MKYHFRHLRMWSIIAIVASIALKSNVAAAGDALILGGIEASFNHQVGTAILQQAYKRIEFGIIVKQYPARRSLYESNSGRIDGEVQRIDNIQQEFTNLIRIPVRLFDLTGAVYASKVEFKVDGWQSLKGYRIGIRRGLKWSEKGTRGMNPVVVDGLSKLCELVQTSRIDVFLYNPSIADFYLAKMKIHTVRMLRPLLVRQPLFHYLHRKHQKLVPKITTILQEMAADGTLRQIHEAVINSALQK